jgi:hypothetical protein
VKGFLEDRKGIIDSIAGKLISRKFLVWITATFLLLAGVLLSSEWTLVSLIYLGYEGVGDLFARYFGSKSDMMVATREHLDDPETPPVITNKDDEVGI